MVKRKRSTQRQHQSNWITTRKQHKMSTQISLLPRWSPREGLELKEITKVLLQSQANGFWYHISLSATDEVRGPYRTRTIAKNAYDIDLQDLVNLRKEVAQATKGNAEEHESFVQKRSERVHFKQ